MSQRNTAASAGRSDVWLALVVFVFVPTALMAYSALYHEFWRDEVQVYLIGVHAPIPQFFSVMHVEGIPFLFHLLFKLVGHVLPPLPTMLVCGWIGFEVLLLGSYRLLYAISGHRTRSLLLTLALSLTYNYSYELGAIVRQYGISLGLALLTMALLREALHSNRRVFVVQGAVACALGAIGSAHGAALCGAALLSFGLFALLRRQLDWVSVLAALGTLPFFAVTAYLAMPFAGRVAGAHQPSVTSAAEFVMVLRQAVLSSLTPDDFWWSTSFGEPRYLSWLGRVRGLAPWLLGGGVLALVSRGRALLAPALEHFDWVAVLVGWLVVGEIILHHYWGSTRHHLFFSGLAVVVALGWIAQSRWWAPLLVSTVPFFAFEILLAARVLRLDYAERFSDAKMQAARLAPNAHVIADEFMYYQPLLFWRPDITLRGLDQEGRRAKYTLADTTWKKRTPARTLVEAECKEAPDRVFYAGGGAGALSACLQLAGKATPHVDAMRTREQYDLWRVDCTCVESKP